MFYASTQCLIRTTVGAVATQTTHIRASGLLCADWNASRINLRFTL